MPPPVADMNAFDNVFRGIPLYVPAATLSSYPVAYAWREFTNIPPLSTEGVDRIEALNANICQRNGQLVVEGTDGLTVTLYDAAGRQLAVRRNEGAPMHFDVPASGTYLVKIGSAPARRIVMVK